MKPLFPNTNTARQIQLENLQQSLLKNHDAVALSLKRNHERVGEQLFGELIINDEVISVQERLDLLGANALKFFALAGMLRAYVNGQTEVDVVIGSALPVGATLEFNEDGSAVYTPMK